jgi:hypothetical protein
LPDSLRHRYATPSLFYSGTDIIAWVPKLHSVKRKFLYREVPKVRVYLRAKRFQVSEIVCSGKVALMQYQKRLQHLLHKLLAMEAHSSGHNVGFGKHQLMLGNAIVL